MLGGEAGAAILAGRLTDLLRASVAPGDSDAARQDCLDLLAVARGLKPVALLGCGYETGIWLAALADCAAAGGLAVRRGGVPWLVQEEFAGLPDWYAEPAQQAWQA